jgi:hypothetical protein
MATQTTVIPLSNLQRPAIQGRNNQAPMSSNIFIQAQQRPSAPNFTSASPSIQSTPALLRAPFPAPPTPSSTSQRWWHATTKHCSSTRVGVLIALIALGVGGYYYYGQYKISWKSWEIGVWKDCRDRVVSQALSFTVDNISEVITRISSPRVFAISISMLATTKLQAGASNRI